MNYLLSQALSYNILKNPRVLLMYDIMYQYSVHLCRCFSESPYLSMPEGIEINGAISLFHIHGYQDTCFP